MAADIGSELEVWGLTDDVDDDFLQLYFENNRRSGGGPIQSFSRSGSVALITFCSPADVEAVLSKEEHRLQHVRVQVRRPPPWDPRKVALCGLDPITDETLLELYMESVSRRDTYTIIRSSDGTSALASFQEDLSEEDFHHLLARVKEKQLHHRSISARRVRACGDLLVQNIGGQISEDFLEMYFESKRSGGGALRSITMLRKNSAAIVSFCEWNVVDRVLARPHTLQNRQLSVSPYYPDLLGNLSNDITQEREMEENEYTKTPDNETMRDPGSELLGAPTGDIKEPSIGGKDGKRVGVKLCDVVETQHNTHYPRPEAPQPRPEAPQPRPEAPQPRPHSQTLDSADDLHSLRTIHSPDTDKGEHPGRLPDPLPTSVSWGVGGKGIDVGGTPSSACEEEVVMEADELSFLQKYHHELLAGMDAVTIFPLEEDDKFGFKVIGDAFSCRTTVELLQHILSSLSSRTITLQYPWVSHFLLESEGQRILRDTESQHQCIINTSHISWKVLDCVYEDPWSFVHDEAPTEESPAPSMITDEVPEDPLLQADMEGIKIFASLLKSEERPNDHLSSDSSTTLGRDIHKEGLDEDLYTESSSKDDDDVSATSEVKDEEMDQVCQISRKEFQDQQLDEEAQLLLAIQRSMDTRGISSHTEEEEELQRVLEMSLMQQESEESLQRALEMSLQDQRSHDYSEPMRTPEDPASFNETKATSGLAQIRILAGDETSIVVAGRALRKAITSKLNTVSFEGTEGVKNISQILDAMEKKHKVRITKYGRELQIQGFLRGPNQCRQEMSEILNAIQAKGQAKAEEMDLDIERAVEMTDVPENSEEHQRVIQPFLNTLQDLKLSIDILQVQKVTNNLLYNQYKLKKLRMVMSDPNKPAERILYHGTSEASAREICHHGFNRSFCGKNATLYGQGVYFAVESEISTRDNYSPPNKKGKKFVLVSRVLTGEYTLGKENMRTPPVIPNSTGEVPPRYDSLVNNMRNPSIFVIFNDTQAYPQYLITCSNRKDLLK